MSALRFQPFRPDLDAATTVMIDGYAPGFRMISHWPGHGTPAPLRHDLTTGSAFLYADMPASQRDALIGPFAVVTNNHYDTDGALSLFTMLRPEVALRHRNLMLRAARSGDFAVWGGADALALELSVMTDVEPYMPFSTPPYDAERLGNLSRAYERLFANIEGMLEDPFALEAKWRARHQRVVADIDRIERGEGIRSTLLPDDDLAIVETERPITSFGMRLVAGDLFRVLLVQPGERGNRYRFCFRSGSTSWSAGAKNCGGRRRRTGPFPNWDSARPSRFAIRRRGSIRALQATRRAVCRPMSSWRN